jgi:hypothetical protein
MDMTNTQTSALARYFTGRVEKARIALSACLLLHYADEVCVMLPKTSAEFERFVYWTENMAAMFRNWTGIIQVRQTHPAETLAAAQTALDTLATDARALLTQYQARIARGQG